MVLLVCSGLNENGHDRLLYLNVQSLVGGTVWEGLEGMSLLEEVCLGVVLGFQKLTLGFFSACKSDCKALSYCLSLSASHHDAP